MGNNLSKRWAVALAEAQDIAFRSGFQCACDIWPLAMAQSEGMGPVPIARISDTFDALYKKYGKAWLPTDPEADWMQEQIDAALKRLYPDRFVPFYKRNPYVRPVNYGKKGVKR